MDKFNVIDAKIDAKKVFGPYDAIADMYREEIEALENHLDLIKSGQVVSPSREEVEKMENRLTWVKREQAILQRKEIDKLKGIATVEIMPFCERLREALGDFNGVIVKPGIYFSIFSPEVSGIANSTEDCKAWLERMKREKSDGTAVPVVQVIHPCRNDGKQASSYIVSDEYTILNNDKIRELLEKPELILDSYIQKIVFRPYSINSGDGFIKRGIVPRINLGVLRGIFSESEKVVDEAAIAEMVIIFDERFDEAQRNDRRRSSRVGLPSEKIIFPTKAAVTSGCVGANPPAKPEDDRWTRI